MGFRIITERDDSVEKLRREDYLGDTFHVAKNVLLGATLCSNIGGVPTGGIITELEVYIGGEDKASHAYRNRRTARTEVMFGERGRAYVFFVYGMHSQFCAVTGPEGVADAVLIRSIEPVVGLEAMKVRRGVEDIRRLTVGPGNVCKALGITKAHYGADLCGGELYILRRERDITVAEAARVGVDYAEEYAAKPWRYYIADSEYVSHKPR